MSTESIPNPPAHINLKSNAGFSTRIAITEADIVDANEIIVHLTNLFRFPILGVSW